MLTFLPLLTSPQTFGALKRFICFIFMIAAMKPTIMKMSTLTMKMPYIATQNISLSGIAFSFPFMMYSCTPLGEYRAGDVGDIREGDSRSRGIEALLEIAVEYPEEDTGHEDRQSVSVGLEGMEYNAAEHKFLEYRGNDHQHEEHKERASHTALLLFGNGVELFREVSL